MINSYKLKLTQQFRLLSLIVTIGLISSVIGHLIFLWLGLKISPNLVTKINFMNPANWVKLAVLCVIEEIIFRGVLSLNVKATCVSIFFWLILLFSYILKIVFNSNIRSTGHHTIFIGSYILLSFCMTYIIYRKYLKSIIAVFKMNYNLLFWTLCILFALSHIDNYVNHTSHLPLYLVLIVPQFIMGSLLAVARIRNGIISSSVIHFFADAWFFTFSLESIVSGYPAVKLVIGIFLSIIFFTGLMQIKLCKSMAYVLMKPSIRILGKQGAGCTYQI